MQEVSYGCIIWYKKSAILKVLLICSLGGTRGFPKGHQEKGESPKQTAIREVLEETGIHVSYVIPYVCFRHEYQLQNAKTKTVGYFVGYSDTMAVRIQNEEIRDYGRFDYHDARNRLSFEDAKIILDHAYQIIIENEKKLHK